MNTLPDYAFRLLLDRAGLTLTPVEVERLKPLFGGYVDHLRALHEADLRREEVAGVFLPVWPPG